MRITSSFIKFNISLCRDVSFSLQSSTFNANVINWIITYTGITGKHKFEGNTGSLNGVFLLFIFLLVIIIIVGISYHINQFINGIEIGFARFYYVGADTLPIIFLSSWFILIETSPRASMPRVTALKL